MIGQSEETSVRSSSLGMYLRAEIDKRGWNDLLLSSKSGVDKGTLHNLLHNPDVVPTLTTLDRLASALSVPLARLVEQTGFSLGPDRRAATVGRIAELFEGDPRLAAVIEELTALPPDDLPAVAAYIAGRRGSHRRRQRHFHQEIDR